LPDRLEPGCRRRLFGRKLYALINRDISDNIVSPRRRRKAPASPSVSGFPRFLWMLLPLSDGGAFSSSASAASRLLFFVVGRFASA
jgi:hypothetical protein